MSDVREHFLDWLRDAHAMEEQAESMLTSMADRVEDYPELHQRVKLHIAETKSQQDKVESCIKRLDSSPSSFKDLAAKTTAKFQAMAGMMTEDEVVKGIMSAYVFECMEIASYKVLVSTAEILGEHEIKTTLEGVLAQEKEMAKWLYDHIPQTTRSYLQKEAD